jgi:hypothetical protein
MTTKQVRLRRGTTQEHENFVGVQGEVTVDTDKKTLRVHDNNTPGGTLLATEQFVEDSLVNVTQGPAGPQGPAGTTNYNDLTNKPTLSNVATTGSFYDLTNIPDEIERLVWVGLNGSDNLDYEGRGNALLPFRTIQAAIDYINSEDGGAILLAPGNHVGDISINSEKAIIIYGFDASHTKNTVIKGKITVTNGNSNFSVRNIDISPNGNHTAIDLQAFGVVSFENSVIEAPQALNGTDLVKIGGSNGLAVNFENCTIIENNTAGINITNTNPLLTVSFDNMQGNPNIRANGACRFLYTGSAGVGNVTASGTGPVQLSSISQCGTVTHTNGSIVISNVAFIQGVSSTVNAGLGYSFNMSNVNFLRTDGTYSPLNKTGTCSYTITNTNYNVATSVIAGQRRSYGTLTGDIGRTVKLVAAATHTCSGSDEELLVNYAGDAVITLPNPGVNGMKIKVRDISGNLGKTNKIYSPQYGIDRPGLTIKIQVADGSNHKISSSSGFGSDYVGIPNAHGGREFIFFDGIWYIENLTSLIDDSWYAPKLAGVELINSRYPGDDLGGAGFIPDSKGHSSWDLELGAYSYEHIDRSFFHEDDIYGNPQAWSRIWLSNRGAIIGNNPYGGASLTLDGGTLNLKSPLDITTPNGIKTSNLHVTPSNLWEYSRLTIDSGLSYSNTTRMDFTNSRAGAKWIAVGGKRDGGEFMFNDPTSGIWTSNDGISFNVVPTPFDEPGYGQAQFEHIAHIPGGMWGTLLTITKSMRLFKSINGGDAWTEVEHNGLPEASYYTPSLIGAGTRFYLICLRDILQSTDAGITWTTVLPTEVELDEQIQLTAGAYNAETNTLIVVGGKYDPSSFGWKGSYAIRSDLSTTDLNQWTTIVNTTAGGIIGIATVTDYDGIDRWGFVREKSWNEAIHGWGVAPALWNEGNPYVTVQFSRRLSTIVPGLNPNQQEPSYNQTDFYYNQPTSVNGVQGGITGQSVLKWEDPNFFSLIMGRCRMVMDRVGTPLMFVQAYQWMGGEEGGFGMSHMYTVPDKDTVNPHEDLTTNFAAGQMKALAVHVDGPNMMVVADGDYATYGVGRMVSTDGRNYQTWYSLSGVYTESNPQGENWIDVQKAPVNDIIVINPSTNYEPTVASLFADPDNSNFRIQGKQVGSGVIIDTRDINGVLSYNLVCYDNHVYAKNLVLDGALTSMSNIINLDNLAYANVGLGFKNQYGIYHNPYPNGYTSVPAGQLVVLASYNEQFTSAKFMINAQADNGVHGQTSEIIVTGLTNNINNPNGSVTSVTNNGGQAWLAFGIQRNPDNIQEIQIVCAAAYDCTVSVLPILMISPNLY